MTELKTLKDLRKEFISNDKDFVFVDELKAEAVKWGKYFKENIDCTFFVDDWIKHFFNLTKEELK